MRTIYLKLLILTLILFCLNAMNSYSQQKVSSVVVQKIWESADLLTTCESVCHYPAENVLFVSCINGNPTDKDGNGFIAKLTLTGEIILLNWLSGLNAPKGMGIYLNKLFVTDIDRIVEIDINKSLVEKDYPVDGARFLNDITIDNHGLVYISDMATGKIHRLNKGMIETWLEHQEIINPNGIFYEDGEILIGSKNGLYSTNIDEMRTWRIIKDTGGIDGLKSDGRKNYIISDWLGKVQLINSNKDAIILINTSEMGINSADIEFITTTSTLFVPTFSDNRVVAYELIYK